MMDISRVFGIYPTSQQAEFVDQLIQSGVLKGSISVLHPDNRSTRKFAERKGTRCPESISRGKAASFPLDGTLGWLDPGEGPIGGALSEALAVMGVPATWSDGRVVHGKVLLSAECVGGAEQAQLTSDILMNTGAEDVGSVLI